jgi:ribosomal protein S18 acetylase RimI-like enzyme
MIANARRIAKCRFGRAMRVRAYVEADEPWAESVLGGEFGGRIQARRGEVHDVLALPGLVAEADGRPVGLLTYDRKGAECELAVIVAAERHRGVGTALVEALLRELSGCERIWVVTTNDNLEALRFYQRRGFVLWRCAPARSTRHVRD